MALSYLILGSNSTEKGDMLQRAITFLEQDLGPIVVLSSIYETAAWGYESKNSYYNQVVSIETVHSPLETLRITQKIERSLGRKNKSINGVYTDRPIDIDILLYDQRVINLPELTIPHPHICERRFVLTPLQEVAPDLQHPIRCNTINHLLETCEDQLVVTKL